MSWDLRQKYENLAKRARLRTVEAAQRLGVSELELLDAYPECVHRLTGEFNRIFSALGEIGPLLALTRNAHAVLECGGLYTPFAYSEENSLVLGEAVDLRLSTRRFAHARLVDWLNPFRIPAGVLFFDAQGRAIHKAFFTADTSADAADVVLERFAADPRIAAALPERRVERQPTPEAPSRPLSAVAVDAEEVRKAWSEMQDTHDIAPLLQRLRLSRIEALRLLGRDWAWPAHPHSLWLLMQELAGTGFPIMVFVGNHAVTQIYKGPVERPVMAGTWWNVLDRRFNLHVEASGLGESWVVRKPVPEGAVTSLEVFDRAGELVLLVFARRGVGQPEPEEWRERLRAIVRAEGDGV